MFKLRKNRGYSLVEIVIYTGILVSLIVIIVNLMVGLMQARGRINAAQNISYSANAALDRMTREIRGATNVSASQSTLGTSPGHLYLNTEDENGVDKTVEFYITGGALRIRENGVDQGPLTVSGATVTSLTFYRSATTSAEAVRVDMTLTSGTGNHAKTEILHTTGLLRSL